MDFISHQAEKILACYTDSSLDSCINKAQVEENDIEKSKSDDKFAKVMGEFKAGTLKSSDGSPVTKRSQAIAIAMSESGRDMEKADMEDETED